VNVSNLKVSDRFYNGFLSWLGYERILSSDQTKGTMVAWRGRGGSLYLTATEKGFTREKFHRKHVGLNHIAFRAGSKKSVDKFYKEYLVPHHIRVLYGGPKEYGFGKGWYSVYFEDPDRIKLEFVRTPT